MSSQQNELTARIDSVTQLGGVVGVLRSIAAAHAQRSRDSLAGIRSYADTVAAAIAHALALMPAPDGAPAAGKAPPALLLFCAEQGFAGNFTERIFAAADMAQPSSLLLVGRRGLPAAQALGLRVDWHTPSVANTAAAPALADRIAAELMRRIASGAVGRIEIVVARPQDGQDSTVQRLSLLPLDLQGFRRALQGPMPLIQLQPAALIERLAIEYLRARLTEAIVQSFAAENLARMQAMSAAHDNIHRTLAELQRSARIARQDAITAEVVELSTGTRAQNPASSS